MAQGPHHRPLQGHRQAAQPQVHWFVAFGDITYPKDHQCYIGLGEHRLAAHEVTRMIRPAHISSSLLCRPLLHHPLLARQRRGQQSVHPVGLQLRARRHGRVHGCVV